MSRTIRRIDNSGKTLLKRWYGSDLDRLSLGLPVDKWPRLYSELSDKQYVIKRVKRFHSDKDFGWTAPADFRRDLNQQLRSKNRQLLRNTIIKDPTNTPEFMPFKRNAGWYYF